MTNKKLKKKQKFLARKLAKNLVKIETATVRPPENAMLRRKPE